MGHDHDHDHGHWVSAGEAGNRRRLAVVLAITATVLVVELVGAAISGSLALLADAGHALTDVFGLSLALVAAVLARRPATPERTWGYRRAEVLAAAAQSAVLLAVGVFVVVQAIQRLLDPPEVGSTAMVVFGFLGLVGNSVSIAVLARAQRLNMNMRAAFLEVVNDALGSAAVLVAAVSIAWFGWQRADAVASLVIGGLILPRTWRLLRETVDVLLEATPKGLELDGVRAHILGLPHVLDVHDLHASQVAPNLPILTAHVVVDEGCFHDGHAPQILDQLQQCVAEHHGVSVEHSTFQLEAAGHDQHEHPSHP